MYINTIIIKAAQQRTQWIESAYQQREQTDLEELLILRQNDFDIIFSVGLDPIMLDSGIKKFIGSCRGLSDSKIVREITHLESFRYFLEMLLGNHSHTSDFSENLTQIKEDFNRALSHNSVGAVLTRIYRQGLDFATEVFRRPQITNNPVGEAEVITDIALKISEKLDRFQFLLIGDNRNRIEQLLQVLRGFSPKKVLLYSENFKSTYLNSVELGCVPVELAQLPEFLKTDTLMVNSGKNDLRLWDRILPVIRDHRDNLYLYFQYASNSLPAGLKKLSNLFIQNGQHIKDVITLHAQKRSHYLAEINAEIDSEVTKFNDWLFSEERFSFGDMVSQNRHMHKIFELIRRIAPTDVNVLINGDTGTGKELVARAIHNHSSRSSGQFIAVNCSAIPESLLESELFGYERGAFTGAVAMKKGLVEIASGGTLFLDEIGDVPPLIQVKLLRVLQEREIMRLGNPSPIKVDVRLVAATHKNLREDAENKSFRSDLYYRLNTVQINLPRLVDRKEDIILLVRHFIEKINKRLGKNIRTLGDDARKILLQYHWPGNVRELENVIERAVAVSIGEKITPTDLPSHLQISDGNPGKTAVEKSGTEKSLKNLESVHIRELLEKEKMNYARVAEILGISRTTLWRKMKEYQIRK